jgi:hypothetical protein
MEVEWPSAQRLAQFPAAAEILNRFYWNLSVEHRGNEVWLRSGERLVATFSSNEELEVFTAGMALALSVLPQEVVAVIDQFAQE